MSETYIVVTPFFPSPSDWRGAYCYDFVKALKKTLDGWRVEVFRPGDGADYEIGGITIRTFRTRQLPSNLFPFLFRRWNEKNFLGKLKSVGIKIDDVVVCHGHTADFAIYPLAVRRYNPHCKTLLHHHDLASFGLNNGRLRHCWLYNLYLFPVLRRLHEQIDTHVFISEASRKSFLMAPDAGWTVHDDYKRQMRGLPYRPVRIKDSVILHNGVDMALFSKLDNAQVSRTKEFTIGCVGNFDDVKDQMVLLLAVKLLKDVLPERLKLIFVGSGPRREMCQRFAQQNGLDAEFRSEVRHENLVSFYRELDLFVLPSYFEGFGCVFTEAHACGVPFITCEGQGMDDLILPEDRVLWLCKPKDPVDLAAKILYYMRHRPIQRLAEDQDIDKLVGAFVEKVLP